MEYACLGPEGTFSEEVASRYYADRVHGGRLLCSTNVEVVQAVADGIVKTGIVPLENSTEGTVNQVVDALLSHSHIYVVDEMVVPIYHHLVGLRQQNAYSLECIERVLSHPQALAQCWKWLKAHLPSATFEETTSTAQAAAIVREANDPRIAAVGNRPSARLYELDILADSIQDVKENATRFVALALRERLRQKGRYKTSVAFSTIRDKAGSLVDVLLILKEYGLNMTKIESRPAKKTLGDYIFFVDFMGHQEDDIVRRALYQMEKESKFFRILGSYPTRKL